MRYKKKSVKRTVFITGISSGIGAAVALRFARAGWDIIGHYCASEDKAKSLLKPVARMGSSLRLIKADLAKEKELKKLLTAIAKLPIDTLVNNAGTYISAKHYTELTLGDLRDVFSVNVFSPLLISSSVLPKMKQGGFGRIVNISSIAAKYGGSANSLHYGASKRALEALTKTLSREGAGDNVLVNTVRPGVIDTEFHKKFPKNMEKRISMIPMKQMGTPAAVADLIYYLGSDENSFITNETVTIAGGE